MTRRVLMATIVACALAPATARAAVTASIASGTLAVVGTDSADTIGLTVNGANLDIESGGGAPPEVTFALASFDRVVVNLGLGEDALTTNGSLAGKDPSFNGGMGNDVLVGDSAGETFVGGDGNDSVFAGGGDDTFIWNPGEDNDVLEGMAGTDTLVFTGANIAESIGLQPNGPRVQLTRDVANVLLDIDGTERIDLSLLFGADTYTATGSLANELERVSVSGGFGTDTLNGGDVDEVLSGGPDTDTIHGAGGDDVLAIAFPEGGGTLDGGEGTDTLALTGTSESETVSVHAPSPGALSVVQTPDNAAQTASAVERVTLDAGAGDDTLALTPAAISAFTIDARGGDGADTLAGGDAADVLRGGPGNDALTGNGGDDDLFGDEGSDTLTGGAGNDAFHCGAPEDVLDAGAGDAVDPDCLAPVTPPAPVTTTVVTTVTAPATTPPAGLPPGSRGFAITRVTGSLSALMVRIENTINAAITVSLGATERRGATRRYTPVTATIAAHRMVTITLRTPAALKSALTRALRRARSVKRRPTVTVTNTATGGKATASPKLTLRRS